MNATERIAKRLRQTREGRGLTRKEVTTILGKHAQTLYRYEKGLTRPTYATLEELCRLYGVTMASIVDHKHAKPNI
jgi:transcriptional regulator with XRE-family HTH domain